jgi:hypothetical protein
VDVLLRQLDFQESLLGMLDCSALIAGQAMDLRLGNELNDATRVYVNQLKTVPLFQLSVRAGLTAAAVDEPITKHLMRFGHEFGAAYQAVDDYLDGHSNGFSTVEQHISAAIGTLGQLPLETEDLEGLVTYIHAKAWQKYRSHR